MRAPFNMPLCDIEAFIKAKNDWIIEKQTAAIDRADKAEELHWRDGAVLPYLGQNVTVRLETARLPKLENGTLYLPRCRSLRTEGRRWLTDRAKELLPQRVAHWARIMHLSPARLEWSGAKRRWGSMSSDGTMRLNIALMHCPWDAIDYVIVHELAHIKVPNHSPAFHALVRSYLPDADVRRASMKKMSLYTEI